MGIIDRLKGVQTFLQQQSNKLSALSGAAGKAELETPYSKELGQLQQQPNTQLNVDALIGQRTSALEGLAGKANIGGLQNIQKNIYYAKEKIKAWK